MNRSRKEKLAKGAAKIRKAEADTRRLAELENRIERGLVTFVDVGSALLEIRDSKLYKVKHKTFEAYCKEKWSMSVAHAKRLMNATVIAYNLAPIGAKTTKVAFTILPHKESQIRPLVRLLPEAQREVWGKAVELAGGQPTAQQVAELSELKTGIEKLDEIIRSKEKPVNKEPDAVDKLVRAFREHKATIRALPSDIPREAIDRLVMVLDGVRGTAYAVREPDKSGPMTDDSLMPYGKYKNTPLWKVPDDYWQWWKNKHPDPDVIEAETGSYDFRKRSIARQNLKLWDYIQGRFSR
jgi:hypothetical protein